MSAKSKPGYIYLIHAIGTNRYKIGLTVRTVEERFAELNSSQSAYPLKLVNYISVSDVHGTERYFHQKYARCQVHGEWFQFSDRDLNQVLAEFKSKNPKPLFTWKLFAAAITTVIVLIQWLKPFDQLNEVRHQERLEHGN